MTEKSTLGNKGEEIACQYLESKGYFVIERNFREKWGEIDIIAKSNDKTLVFIEVKTMKKSDYLKPEDNLTTAKLKKVKRTASLYAGKHQEFINETAGWRIDLMAIQVLTDSKNNVLNQEIYHYENI